MAATKASIDPSNGHSPFVYRAAIVEMANQAPRTTSWGYPIVWGMVVELGLVHDLHLFAADFEVQVEVDSHEFGVTVWRLEGSCCVDLVTADGPRVSATAQDPPFARYRDPQLVAPDELDGT